MKSFNQDIKQNIEKFCEANRMNISKLQIKSVIDIFANSKYINSLNIDSIDVEGMGGNGIVFKYKIEDKLFCIKCLYNRYGNREKRFYNEIEAMEKLSGTYGIVPLLHSGLDEDKDYFVMPYFENYKIESEQSGFKERIEDMIQLAKIIKSIHDRDGINAHRDIKLDNIFKQDGIMYLSDFGLVKFDDDRKDITQYERHIGPWNISPPEFYSAKLRSRLESYDISDVYLFAKVVWQVLMKDENGFWGAYIDNLDNFIDIGDIRERYNTERIVSIEPINSMIINTTSNSIPYRKKFNIDYCIECLENEIKILDDIGKNDKKEYDDKINNLMFFQNNAQMTISLEDENAISIVKKIIESEDSVKSLRSFKFSSEQPIDLSINMFSYYNNKISIVDRYRTVFLGEIRFSVVDNLRKEIIIEFEDNYDEIYETYYDRIEKYRQFDENKKYLLDKDCELIIKYSNNHLKYKYNSMW